MRRYTPSGHDHRIYIERLLIAAAIVVLLLFLWAIVDLLVLVFGAIVVAVLLRAIADPLARRTPLGDKGGVALAVLLIAGIMGVAGWLFGAQIRSQFADLAETLPTAARDLQVRIAELPFGERALEAINSYTPEGTNIVSRVGSLLLMIGSGIADLLLIVFGAIFIAAQPQLYRRGLLKLLPSRARDTVGDALDDSGRALKLWILGQLVSMAIIGALTWLGLWLVGLPSAAALGLIAGFAEIIPYAGPVLAAVPGLLIALLQGPETALWTLAVYLGVQQIEGSIVMPVVQRKAVKLPPALTLFAIIAAGLVFGFVGLIFAAPLVVVAYVLVKRLYVREALNTPTSIPGEKDGSG